MPMNSAASSPSSALLNIPDAGIRIAADVPAGQCCRTSSQSLLIAAPSFFADTSIAETILSAPDLLSFVMSLVCPTGVGNDLARTLLSTMVGRKGHATGRRRYALISD